MFSERFFVDVSKIFRQVWSRALLHGCLNREVFLLSSKQAEARNGCITVLINDRLHCFISSVSTILNKIVGQN